MKNKGSRGKNLKRKGARKERSRLRKRRGKKKTPPEVIAFKDKVTKAILEIMPGIKSEVMSSGKLDPVTMRRKIAEVGGIVAKNKREKKIAERLLDKWNREC